MTTGLKKIAVISMLVALAGLPAVISAEDRYDSSGHPRNRSARIPVNPLIEEMAKLDNVIREVVSAVAIGDGERVHEALHSMHGTMEKTHEAVHSGTVRTPKNADKIEGFIKMDKKFHDNLEALAMAAYNNDHKGMLSLTKKAIDGCVSCHHAFRK